MSDQPTAARGVGVIVVGVDGSEPSKQALQWAARQAKLTGFSLRAVMSWDLPAAAFLSAIPQPTNFEADARIALARAVDEALGYSDPVWVTQIVRQGRAQAVLVEESNAADLLVVGNRGHGELAGILLGSVSEHCVTHAHCPVVVVRRRKA
jgi:nucleotide-binding universal stress UspA family protein